ncbi:hypothetical protein D3C72_2224810 [compost metagenome]
MKRMMPEEVWFEIARQLSSMTDQMGSSWWPSASPRAESVMLLRRRSVSLGAMVKRPSRSSSRASLLTATWEKPRALAASVMEMPGDSLTSEKSTNHLGSNFTPAAA